MSPFGLLWAAGGEDLIKILVVLLFILVPAIGQLTAKWRQAQQEAAKRAQGGGQAPGGGPRPRNAADDEIGEFLRRAAQRRAEGAAPPARPPQPPRSLTSPASRAPSARPPAPTIDSGVQVEVVREGGVGSGVGQHVQEYLKTEEIVEHAAHLGAEVTQADERFEQHLHRAFDHELGQLGHFAGESISSTSATSAQARGEQGAELSATAAAGFAALLSSAQSIRQAVILNEILQRPEDRWA